jgi:hypothetical protein
MGVETQAAQLLGVKLTTLNTKIKRYKISFVGHGAEAEHDVLEREECRVRVIRGLANDPGGALFS